MVTIIQNIYAARYIDIYIYASSSCDKNDYGSDKSLRNMRIDYKLGKLS